MFKEPKTYGCTQDYYDRKLFIITPREELLQEITRLNPHITEEELNYFKEPVAIMTEELPFEKELEGHSPAIKKAAIESYITENIEDFPLSKMKLPEGILENEEQLGHFFNYWWNIIGPVDNYELTTESWKK